MGNRLIAVLAALMLNLYGSFVPSVVEARSRTHAAEMAAFFHDDLALYGRWVEHRIYGTVWVPDSGQPHWHPYWNGRWVWTTDYGWYWHSHEPYGWATYHYGRWVLTSDYGWVWVPDTVWGPAWVEWRYGGGYAGWAPMPPPEEKRGTTVETRAWVFVPEADIAKADGRQRAAAAEVAQLLKASSVTAGTDLAVLVHAQPQTVASVTSAAEQAAATATGQVAIYRPPLLTRLNSAAPGLNLEVPLDTTTEIDPGAAAKAESKFDDALVPDKPLSGSVESTMGGTFDAEKSMRTPSSGGGGGIGVNLPAAGGVRLGR